VPDIRRRGGDHDPRPEGNRNQNHDIGAAVNRESISKLEHMFRDSFFRLYDMYFRHEPVIKHDCVMLKWTEFLKGHGCYFLLKGRLVEPVNHPKGFVLVSDPIRCRTIAAPTEFALKALYFGEIP
jgi:hypothetical protein